MRGDGVVTRRTSLFLGVSLAVLGGATMASAQGMPPPPPAPPGGVAVTQPPPAGAPPAAPNAMPPVPSPTQVAQPTPPPQGAGGYPPPIYPPGMMLSPSRLPFIEAEPVPAGYEVQTRPRMGMAKAGIATFVPLFGLTALFGGVFLGSESGEAKQYGPLIIPVLGPFITIGTSDAEEFGAGFLVVDGLGQLAGAALFIGGLLSEEKYLVRSGKSVRPEVSIGPGSMALRWQF
jgi:hypothetical protein